MGRDHLLAAPEPRHSYLRRLIMPAFSGEAIDKLLPRMDSVLGKYLASWAGSPAPIKAHDQLRAMTFEFIIAVVMGRDYPPEVTRRLSSCFSTWTKVCSPGAGGCLDGTRRACQQGRRSAGRRRVCHGGRRQPVSLLPSQQQALAARFPRCPTTLPISMPSGY